MTTTRHASIPDTYDAILIGSGPGEATVARELVLGLPWHKLDKN